jgi:DNA adenine methylase
VTQNSNYNLQRIPEVIEQAHQRLLRVQIESMPYEDVLERYDRPTTVFYLDPPYWGVKLYKFNFTPEDFETLAARLAKLKGKFILSLNDLPEVRAAFSDFEITPCRITYTAKRNATKKFGEVLITNFPAAISDDD